MFTWWSGIDANHLNIKLKIFGIRANLWVPSWRSVGSSNEDSIQCSIGVSTEGSSRRYRPILSHEELPDRV